MTATELFEKNYREWVSYTGDTTFKRMWNSLYGKTCFLCEPTYFPSAHKLQLAKAEIQFDDDQWTKENPYLKGENNMRERETIHDILARYASADVISTQILYNKMYKHKVPEIKNVIFNDPATIVIWADGTKTVVKTQNDEIFDPEKGLAMAIAKKALGNEGNYFNEIKKWTDKYLETVCPSISPISIDLSDIRNEAFPLCFYAGQHYTDGTEEK